MNLEQRAKHAPSVTIYLILLHKDLNQLVGEFISNNSLIFLFVLLKTKQKSQFEQWVAYRACINILTRIMHYTALVWNDLPGPLCHSGKPIPKRTNSATLNGKDAAQYCFPKMSLQIVSLNKYTMWQKFKDQKKVFKKLKLVHTTSGKNKSRSIIHLMMLLDLKWILHRQSLQWQPELLNKWNILPFK